MPFCKYVKVYYRPSFASLWEFMLHTSSFFFLNSLLFSLLSTLIHVRIFQSYDQIWLNNKRLIAAFMVSTNLFVFQTESFLLELNLCLRLIFAFLTKGFFFVRWLFFPTDLFMFEWLDIQRILSDYSLTCFRFVWCLLFLQFFIHHNTSWCYN